jgi:hypothetical protein
MTFGVRRPFGKAGVMEWLTAGAKTQKTFGVNTYCGLGYFPIRIRGVDDPGALVSPGKRVPRVPRN